MFFKRMSKIVSGAAEGALSYAELQINPETKGVAGLAASLALLVMADKVAEEQELEDVSEYLVDMDLVIEHNLIREVSESFMGTVTKLEDGFASGVVEGNIIVGEILNQIATLKKD